jgi:HD-GYP domain-containing protein (c-di-GMP phosphodiesterase class II)
LFAGLHSVACVPVIAQHQPIGTLWVGRQSPIQEEEVSLLSAIGEMVGNAIHRMKLHMQTERLLDDLQDANRELSQAYDTTLEGWARALELRDKETEGHSRRVTELTVQLARRMGITEAELINIRRGVLLHDIGKMGITDQLLRKTAPLTEDEWGEMRKHPNYAYDLLFPITYLRPALDVPYCHHEKWDGTGYPRGLMGEQIPLAARIFAVVDVYDALLNDRPYRAAWPPRKVMSYLREQAGKHFDPQVVEIFLDMLRDNRLAADEGQ